MVTVRDLVRVMPSAWQSMIKQGHQWPFERVRRSRPWQTRPSHDASPAVLAPPRRRGDRRRLGRARSVATDVTSSPCRPRAPRPRCCGSGSLGILGVDPSRTTSPGPSRATSRSATATPSCSAGQHRAEHWPQPQGGQALLDPVPVEQGAAGVSARRDCVGPPGARKRPPGLGRGAQRADHRRAPRVGGPCRRRTSRSCSRCRASPVPGPSEPAGLPGTYRRDHRRVGQGAWPRSTRPCRTPETPTKADGADRRHPEDLVDHCRLRPESRAGS